MDAKEVKRREQQRKTREIVLNFQKQGKSKEEIKKLKNDMKSRANAKPSQSSKRTRNEGENSFNKRSRNERDDLFRKKSFNEDNYTNYKGAGATFTDQEEDPEKAMKRDAMAKKHDVVIIPIIWRRKEEESEMVLDAAQSLKDKLAAHRINTWIDRRHSLSPGQKYAYWESLGVKFRLELGPDEAQKGNVCLSKAVTGELAQRWKDISVKTAATLHVMLQILHHEGLKWLKLDMDPCPGCISIKESDSSFKDAPEPKKSRKHIEFSEEEENQTVDHTKSSGDGLESNYVLE